MSWQWHLRELSEEVVLNNLGISGGRYSSNILDGLKGGHSLQPSYLCYAQPRVPQLSGSDGDGGSGDAGTPVTIVSDSQGGMGDF